MVLCSEMTTKSNGAVLAVTKNNSNYLINIINIYLAHGLLRFESMITVCSKVNDQETEFSGVFLANAAPTGRH